MQTKQTTQNAPGGQSRDPAQQQASVFDRLASSGQLYRYSPDSLRSLHDLVPDKGFVLDVGCGDGIVGQALGADRTIGIEISPQCAQLATKRGIHACVADAASDFPFPDATFDTIYCVNLLHHLPGRFEKTIYAMNRVLRPGGTLAIVENDAQYVFVRWLQAPKSPIRVAPCDNEPAIYTEQITAVLERLQYTFTCRPLQLDMSQVEPSGFPLWQRLAKAPFVIALAWWHGNRPNKYALVARKPAS